MKKRVAALEVLILACVLGALLRVALRLGLDYWDGYDFLNNGLALTGKGLFAYSNVRPPLVPLLNAPALIFYHPGSRFSTTAPHIVAWLLSCFSLVALYRLLRLSFAPAFALAGVTLMAINPLFIHYSVFVMSDIAGACFLMVGFLSYLQSTSRSGAGFLLSALARYSNLLALAALFLFELFKKDWKRLIKVVVLVGLLFYVVHLVIFVQTVQPLWKALLYALALVRNQFIASQQPGLVDPLYEYLLDLLIAFTPPVVVLAIVGIAKRPKTDASLLMLCWLGSFFLFLTLARHKEARYLFSLFPPLVYFVVAGFEYLWRWKRARFIALIFMGPLLLGFAELRRFNDPVYSRPCLAKIAAQVNRRELVGVFTLYPKDRLLFPHDDFIYHHHINSAAMKLWTGPTQGQVHIPTNIYTTTTGAPEPPEPVLSVRCR